jgi:hypothetical protein
MLATISCSSKFVAPILMVGLAAAVPVLLFVLLQPANTSEVVASAASVMSERRRNM